MKIYLALPVVTGRDTDIPYGEILAELQAQGHSVLTQHLLDPIHLNQERACPRPFIFQRDLHWLKEADLFVAEVSLPSTGVGYEICQALHWGKPMVCLAQENRFVSAMVEGNPAVNLIRYDSNEEVRQHLRTWLASLAKSF
jgi:nucleoside 2-deoxyribosyltransferase